MSINVILFEPEIAENTGNIARTCVAFNAKLHLIRPYGFFLNDKKIKRSSVNYWEHLMLFEYDCFEEFLSKNNNPKIFIYTRYGNHKPSDINYYKDSDEIFIMFGRESTGVGEEILKKFKDSLIRVPTSSNVRSINLSNTVAIALYEIIKQNHYKDLEIFEPHKKSFKI